MKQIIEFEIKDHGVIHAQFFEPPSKEEYDEIHIGMSYDNYKNALYDAVDSLLFGNYEIPDRMQAALDRADEEDMVEHCITTNAFASDSEPGLLGYYVSIRVKGEADANGTY